MNSIYTDLLIDQGIDESSLRRDGFVFRTKPHPNPDNTRRSENPRKRRTRVQNRTSSHQHFQRSSHPDHNPSSDPYLSRPFEDLWRKPEVEFYIPPRSEYYHLGYDATKPLFYPYKRMTHFKMYVAALQNTRTLHFSDMTKLKDAYDWPELLKSPNIYFTIRKILQEWRLPKLYPDIFLILAGLGGKPLQLTNTQYHLLLERFQQLEYFFQHQPPEKRKYFLHYYSVLDILLKHLDIPYFYKLPTIRNNDRHIKVYSTLSNYIKQLLP